MIPYFYKPLSSHRGKVLKCAGIATEDNKEWFLEQNPGTVIMDHYCGDKIKADTLEEY